jgi:hypothetical protein
MYYAHQFHTSENEEFIKRHVFLLWSKTSNKRNHDQPSIAVAFSEYGKTTALRSSGYCLSFRPWRRRQQILAKHLYLPTKLYVVITRKYMSFTLWRIIFVEKLFRNQIDVQYPCPTPKMPGFRYSSTVQCLCVLWFEHRYCRVFRLWRCIAVCVVPDVSEETGIFFCDTFFHQFPIPLRWNVKWSS